MLKIKDTKVGNRNVFRHLLDLTPTSIISNVTSDNDISFVSQDDYFGRSCSLSADGTVLAVGADLWDGTVQNQGIVYTYDWNNSTSEWDQRDSVAIASDAGADDYFGRSCSLSSDGTVLAVGATGWDGSGGNSQGAVYIYDWNSSTSEWIQRGSVITASDADTDFNFGSSCSLSSDGTILAVGAYGWNGTSSAQGALYLYDWNSSTSEWDERSDIITASDAGEIDNFGSSCSLSSDGAILAIGAYYWDGSGGDRQGAVYIYDWNSSTSEWDERSFMITASDADAYDFFGASCSLSSDGTILAVGASGWDGSGGSAQGAVYIYDWNSSTSEWDERNALHGSIVWDVLAGVITPDDAGGADYFGSSCCLSSDGSQLFAGAYIWDGTVTGQGCVYSFDLGDVVKDRSDLLTASDAEESDCFGRSCSLSSDGTILAVGAYFWDGSGGNRQGAVYIYDWNSSTSEWDERSFIVTASDAGTDDYFGYSCSLSSDGTILAVGAGYWDGSGGGSQGAVYIYDWNSSTSEWDERSDIITASDANASDYFGTSCSLSSDGTILAVGARAWHGDVISQQGAVYIYDWNSSTSEWDERSFMITASDAGAYDYFGASCSLSSDGTILAVGADEWNGTTYGDQGQVYIYDWNSSTSEWDERSVITKSVAIDENFGSSCSLSSDGTILAIGADQHGGSGAGKVYIYTWNGSSWSQYSSNVITASDAGSGDKFGASCSLSSDGILLAVGAYGWDGPSFGSAQGAVYVANLPFDNSSQTDQIVAGTKTKADSFGQACAISKDGKVMVVGAYDYNDTYDDQGAIFTYDLVASQWIQRGDILTASDAGASDYFGRACSLSSDGAILAVSASGWDGSGGDSQGAVYIYDWNSSTSVWTQRGSVITASDAGAGDGFGHSCSLSSDGTTLAIGTVYWDGTASNQGAVYIYDWNSSTSEWDERSYIITASDAGASDYFGRACSLSSDGTILAVGANYWDGTASDQGTVYIYDWNNSTSEWYQRGSVITASDADASDYFGSSCSLSSDGTTLAVGASSWDGSDGTDQGAIYLYDISGSTYTERSNLLLSPSPVAYEHFGWACALSGDGDILIVGSTKDQGYYPDGCIYTFGIKASEIVLTAYTRNYDLLTS